MKKFAVAVVIIGLLSVGALLLPERQERNPEPSWMAYRTGRQPVVGLADSEVLRDQYELWKREADDPYLVELFASDRVAGPYGAGGWVRMDLVDGRIASRLRGDSLPPLDLWLVDNADWPDNPAVPDPEDRALLVGTYEMEDGEAVLDVRANGLSDEEFAIDIVVVTPAGTTPLDGQQLFYGTPTLFQRLLALEERMERDARGVSSGMLGFAMVMPQSGGVPTGFPDVFADLVTQGENLFFNETFEGNGRTCGTCHFAVNNFTIDTDLLATLPPKDPLFLAEFSPPHIFDHPENRDKAGNPRRFENPALMRAFGLIVENLDGFGDLDERFTMRGVPHNVGMRVSVTRPGGDPGFPNAPDERTGWSGDGSPFGFFSCNATADTADGILVRGTTRSFALGAVIQHFPKTLNRSFCPPEPDIRLPSDKELDAFEAFLFALGRQVELNLASGASNELVLANSNAEAGKVLFRDPGVGEFPNAISCNNCHANGGANPGGVANSNIDTGVEEFLRNRLNDPAFTVIGEPRPFDGGFGLNPAGTFDQLIPGPGNGNENFGDGRFNVVSIVEAADTAPFFHPNIAFTVEESIDFYASDEFSPDPAGKIRFTPAERDQVAAFMRAINALDNIENLAAPRAQKAVDAIVASNPNADDVINFLLEVAIADTVDAIEVLDASDLHDTGGLSVNAVKQLERAKNRFMQAQNTNLPDFLRVSKINEGLANLDNAVGIIRINP